MTSTSEAAETKREAAEFTALVDRHIRAFATDDRLGGKIENALIEIEAQHTKHINAIKREFNADLDRIEEAHRHNQEVAREREERNIAASERRIQQITKDYQQQLESSSETYGRDLRTLKAKYDAIIAEKDRRLTSVAEIQERNAREIALLTKEHERVLENKEKEVDALTRKMTGVFTDANTELSETDLRCRVLEDDNAALRRDVDGLHATLTEKDAALARAMRSGLENLDRVAALCAKALRDAQGQTADNLVERSQMRAVMIDGNYEAIRARLREGEDEEGEEKGAAEAAKKKAGKKVGAAKIHEEVDAAEEAQRHTYQQLEELVDGILERQRAQSAALEVLQKAIAEDAETARGHFSDLQRALDEEQEKRRHAQLLSNTSNNSYLLSYSGFPQSTPTSGRQRRASISGAAASAAAYTPAKEAGNSPQAMNPRPFRSRRSSLSMRSDGSGIFGHNPNFNTSSHVNPTGEGGRRMSAVKFDPATTNSSESGSHPRNSGQERPGAVPVAQQ